MSQFPSPSFSALIKNPIHLLAFGFGSGLSPKAPGTAGTVVAAVLYPLLAMLSQPVFWAVLLLSGLVGIYLCGKTAKDLGVHDHPGIVWDEFVGMWLTMAFVPYSPLLLVIGFVLFRIFDILKPWPINWLDRHVSGGTGIMLDDILAGLMAGIVLWLVNGWL